MTDITQQDLFRFFSTQDKPCPFCDGKAWGVTQASHPIMIVTTNEDGEFDIPPTHLSGYAAVCSSCGFMRIHEARTVHNLIFTHPEG